MYVMRANNGVEERESDEKDGKHSSLAGHWRGETRIWRKWQNWLKVIASEDAEAWLDQIRRVGLNGGNVVEADSMMDATTERGLTYENRPARLSCY